jgi:hypothetical protein
MMGLKKVAETRRGHILTWAGGRGAGALHARDKREQLTRVSYAGIATPGYKLTYHRNGAVKTVTGGKKSR